MLAIHGARLIDRSSGSPELAVLLGDGNILALGAAGDLPCPADAERVDASGLLLSPGFIDLQLNGAFGQDFTAAPQTIWEVGSKLPRYGVTAFLPTIITSPPETVAAGRKVLLASPPKN